MDESRPMGWGDTRDARPRAAPGPARATRPRATMAPSSGRGAARGPVSAMDVLRRTRPGFPSGLEVVVVCEGSNERERAATLLEKASYRVTVMDSLEECARALTVEPAPRRDVVLVEARLLRECLENPASACASKFPEISKKVAIVVLQKDEDDEEGQQFIARALASGAVAVLRYPLVKQNVANLWQHAVRRMILQEGDEKMLAVLKRSSSDSNVHNFERPFARGTNVRDAVAYGESILRSTTPPMSVEAMNAKQAQLLAESEARKARELSAAAKQKKAKVKANSSKAKSAQNISKSNSAGAKAAKTASVGFFTGSSPDEGAFLDVFGDSLRRNMNQDVAAMPIGVQLNNRGSFAQKIKGADVDSDALRAVMQQPFGDDGSYPGGLYGTQTSISFPDAFGGSDFSMVDDYDALDYVLNSSDISLNEPLDDEMIFEALAK